MRLDDKTGEQYLALLKALNQAENPKALCGDFGIGEPLAQALFQQRRPPSAEKTSDASLGFSARLQSVLEVVNEMAKAPGFDELCRTAATLAVSRLGFERIGIWFRDEDPGFLRGSFGVSEDGTVRDERSRKIPISPDDDDARRVLNREVRFALRRDTGLRDAEGNIVGRGTRVMAPVWDGQEVIGFIYIDNHLSHCDITEEQCRILALFAVSVGHLCSLHRTAEALRRGEEERRKLEAQVQHAQKLESLGVLAGGIAHDFNNLLVGVLGNVELAQIELGSFSPASRYLKEIGKAASRAADLCKQMLAYSGKGQFVLELVNLNDVAREMTGLLGVSISKKTRVEFCLLDGLPSVEGDATQLRQGVMNLVTNASEALADKPGVVSISTGAVQCTRQDIESLHARDGMRPGEYVFLDVSDTGCGMDRETLARIFDPFYSTKFTGRGLGLAAVLGIVRGHHGGIRVDSSPGEGTTFRILLPPKTAPSAKPLETESGLVMSGSGTVLVIDDEDQVRELGATMLGVAGYTVLTASDARNGLAVLEANAGKVDVVLLDMAMPGMDGREAYERIRDLDPAVPVVLCSGYGKEASMERFNEGELAGFLAKPFRMGELLAAVRDVITAPGSVEHITR